MKINEDIIRFLSKLLLFSSPFILLISSFIIIDPFKIVRAHTDYNGAFVTLNPDYISTEVYLKNREKLHYNSFIFGNSKTLAFKTSGWKTHLPAGAIPYVYHASHESLFGIWKKIKFIDSKKDTLKNALLIIDNGVLVQTGILYNHLTIKDPRISGESRLVFYNSFFKAYLSDFFFIRIIDYSLFKVKRPYMNGYLDFNNTYYDPVTNDMYPLQKIISRMEDNQSYYQDSLKKFGTPTPVEKPEMEVIKSLQIKMLTEIMQVFKKHNTSYKIIISPFYNYVTLNKKDVALLEEIFGKSNVYNFGGINEYTNNVHNFYDISHYSTETGNSIMKEVYKN